MSSDDQTPRWGAPSQPTAPGAYREEPTVVTNRVYGSATPPEAPVSPIPPPPGPVAAAPPADAPASPPEPSTTPPAPEPAAEAEPDLPEGVADRGRTTIADEVVEQVIQRVVELAVAEVPGVHALREDVDRFFGDSDDQPDRAVSVTMDGSEATINVAIEVEFGHPVHQAVEALRARVIGSAERLLGMRVAEFNVAVAGIAFPPDD